MNRFPAQQPFEIIQEVLDFVGAQLGIDIGHMEQYARRRQTISNHQLLIQRYLNRRRLGPANSQQLQFFLFQQACRLERAEVLEHQARLFMKENNILEPGSSTLDRIVGEQRRQARQYIYQRIAESLTAETMVSLDMMLKVDSGEVSEIQNLKAPPGIPSAGAIINLINRLETIQGTDILTLDLAWLHNNYQRTLASYVRGCSAYRLRQLESHHRYAAIVCFLRQTYQDTTDQIVHMYDRLINRIHNRAQNDVDDHMKQQRHLIQDSLSMFQQLSQVILDEKIEDTELRRALFRRISQEELAKQTHMIKEATSGRKQYQFSGVLRRFHYLRRFSPALLQCLKFEHADTRSSSLLEAVDLLKEINAHNKRLLPESVPTDFVPARLLSFVEQGGAINRQAWECALLTELRDEIKSGNITVSHSKRFGRFHEFLMPYNQWEDVREDFFQRAELPPDAEKACVYLTQRLNRAYDRFLISQKKNSYIRIDNNSWRLSIDPAETLDENAEAQLEQLKSLLSNKMRHIRLPDLLIEVDNDLHFTSHFMLPTEKRAMKRKKQTGDICATIAAIMAHGCNIGPQTMASLTHGISYEQIRHITDWQLTEEAQRSALGGVVQAITNLDVSQRWGQGRTSSSDGQRFSLHRKVLQQTFSTRFRDFALEFYSFVADNYAPFYSLPI
jgi:hypothetical protein